MKIVIKNKKVSGWILLKFGKTLLFFVISMFVNSLPYGLMADENQKLNIVTTTKELGHLAFRIGGKHVKVRALLAADANPHYQSARPDYIMALNRADLFIQNGLELEIGWVPLTLKRSRNPEIQQGRSGFCDASHGIHILEKPTGKLSRKDGDIHPYGNPHYLLDPVNAAIAARNIGRSLVRLDPDRKDYYRTRYKDFARSIKKLLADEEKRSKKTKALDLSVFHKEFSYLIYRFHFREHSSIEEISGIPPSAAWLKKISKKMKVDKVSLILLQPYNNRIYADSVAGRTGARVLVMEPLVTKITQEYAYETGIKSMLHKIYRSSKHR